jgi:GAF domain-containing protein
MPRAAHHEPDALRQQLAAMTRRAARLATINRIGRLITSRLSLHAVFQTAVAAIHTDLQMDYVAAGLVDRDDPAMLVLYAQAGRHAAFVPDDYRQHIDVGLVGLAARTRQPVLVNDVANDPRYLAIRGAPTTHAELAVPIALGERLLGVLNIETDQPIDADEVEAIVAVAEQLAIAIDNARRYGAEQQRRERLALITHIGQRIAARLDPDALFATTMDELRGRMGYDHVSLFLVDDRDPDVLVQHAHASRWPRPDEIGYRQPTTQGVIGAAARTRQPVLIPNVAADRRYVPIPGAPPDMAELAVPILLGERLLGVLDVAGTQRYDAEDIAGVQMIADHLAIAVDNARLFAESQQSLDELHLLYTTGQRLSTALDVDDVIAAYLNEIAVRGRYICSVVLYEIDQAGSKTGVLVRGRWTPDRGVELDPHRLPYTRDALDPPLDAGDTVTISDVQRDQRVSDELRRIQRESGRPALALIPLIARGQRIGLVILSYGHVHDWPLHELRLYQVTAAQLATAIDTRQQQGLLAERGQQLAVFEDRRRLARDLHDSVTQLIFSIMLIAQSLGPAWRRDAVEGERRTERLLDLSQQAFGEMRALLVELRPPTFIPDQPAPTAGTTYVRRDGLVAALRRYTAAFDRDGPAIAITADGYVPQPVAVEEGLLRIAQEALHNVLKHAQASHVWIAVDCDDASVQLRMEDDGRGYDPQAGLQAAPAAAHGGLGLRSMRERVDALGGSFSITGRPGKGTTVLIRVPRQDQEEER